LIFVKNTQGLGVSQKQLTSNYMKKILSLLAFGLLTAACSNDDDNKNDNIPMSERLPGSTWNLTTVKYFAIVPSPDNPNINLPINGNGEEVTGSFTFFTDPDNIDYNISFVASATLPDGQPVVVPIRWENEGSWSLEDNDTKIRVIAENDTLLFSVIENRPNRQVWETTVPQFIGEIGDFVDVNIEFSMVR
jgi:hypothetical protein